MAEWVVLILPMFVEWVVVAGTVSLHGMATTGTVIGMTTTTITSSMATITSTTASSVSDFGWWPAYYGYNYGYGGCAWLRRQALATGSPYWWNRYSSCVNYY